MDQVDSGKHSDGTFWYSYTFPDGTVVMGTGKTQMEAEVNFLQKLMGNENVKGMLPSLKPKPEDVKPENKEWHINLYNDDKHSFDHVIACLIGSIFVKKACEMANQVHTEGKSVVFKGTKEECQHICQMLRANGLQVETDDNSSIPQFEDNKEGSAS